MLSALFAGLPSGLPTSRPSGPWLPTTPVFRIGFPPGSGGACLLLPCWVLSRSSFLRFFFGHCFWHWFPRHWFPSSVPEPVLAPFSFRPAGPPAAWPVGSPRIPRSPSGNGPTACPVPRLALPGRLSPVMLSRSHLRNCSVPGSPLGRRGWTLGT